MDLLTDRGRTRHRIDDQVKVRGHRIELGEIEAVLTAVPGVTASSLPLVGQISRPAVLPVSYGQQSLWLIEQLGGPGSRYVVPLVVKLTGRVDVAAFETAVRDVVDRHEALRTLIIEDGGELQQVIAPADRFHLIVDTLTEGRVDEIVQGRFDLGADLPIRAALLHTSDTTSVFVLAIHHHAIDEWSFPPLLNDLSTAYRARLHGTTPAWQPLPVQYADFAIWQRHMLNTELPTHLDYWRTALDDAPSESTIALDRPRPAEPTHHGTDVHWTIPAETAAGLRQVAHQQGLTMFMIAHSATALTVSALGGGDDIVLGSPVASRDQHELEPVVGYFINTLPLRHRLNPGDTVAELLRRTRQTVLDGFAHQAVPFEEIVRAVGVERHPHRNPLFQVMLAHHADAQSDEVTLDGLVAESLPAALDAAKTDLEIDLVETASGLDGYLTYATDLFDPATIDRFIAVFEQALAAIATEPGARLAELLLTDEATAVAGADLPARPVTLDALIREQVAATPQAIAVIGDDGTTLTYAQFDVRVQAVARELLDRGVRIGDRVAVQLPRSIDLVVTLAAVVRVGAAFVPIDTTYPAARVQTILEDAGDDRLLLITEPLAGADGNVVLARELSLLDTAYVIFTSGTTGRPKGVVVSHRAIVNLIAWRQDTFPIQTGERVLQKTSVGFDVAVPEFFWPLTVGATVRLIKAGGERDPQYLTDVLTHEPVAFVELVPTVLQAMLDIGYQPAVRHLSVGGEALPTELGRRLQALTNIHTWNTYGPTETAVDATGVNLADVDLSIVPVTPIGTPVANVQALVLDSWLRPTAPGVIGELYLSGVQLADGYIGQPGLTAERFIAGDNGQRWYRTGDLVRWNKRGQLDFLGRVDDQVKIRGFRIELDEIRNVLESHEQVSAAAVVALDHPAGGNFLAAYVIGTTDLRAYAEARLPGYMVPTTFTALDSLPVTTNGKLDRRALPTPELGGTTGRAPQTRTEKVLAQVFQEVLHLPSVSADDNFFRLGGDSILSIQAVSRARRAGVTVTAAEFFTARTLAALARLADQHADTADDVVRLPERTGIPASTARARATQVLPDFMPPPVLRAVDAIPGTGSGKVDRNAVAESLAHLPGARPDAHLDGSVERVITDLWADLLKLDAIGPDDDFVALGVHSLLAVRLAARLKQRLAVAVSASALLRHRTLRELAAHVGEMMRAGSAVEASDIVADRSAPADVSFAQSSMWIMQAMRGPAAASYRIPQIWRIGGPLEVAALGAALNDLVDRHEALRTAFRIIDGELKQLVLPAAGLPLTVEEPPAGDPAEWLRERTTAFYRTGFDLAAEIPVRARLFRLGGRDYVLMLVVHHIAHDGWSMEVLNRDLGELYDARLTDRPARLDPLPRQYLDHALAERHRHRDGDHHGAVRWWQAHLAGFQPFPLPADHPAEHMLGARVSTALPSAMARALARLAGKHRTTSFAVLLANLAIVLADWADVHDLVLGVARAGRSEPGAEHLIGPYAGVLPLRVQLGAGVTFAGLLERVQETLLAGEDNEVPLDLILQEMPQLQAAARSGRPVLAAAVSSLLEFTDELRLTGLTVRSEPPPEFDVIQPLAVFFLSGEDGIDLAFEYQAAMFNRETIEKLADRYLANLTAMLGR
jgi:amino acid adenylation domain-containing protein